MVTRRHYLKQLQRDYLTANKAEKTAILDKYIKNTGHNRKYVIGQLNNVKLTRINRNRKKIRCNNG